MFSRFSRDSESFASELRGDHEGMLPWNYVHSHKKIYHDTLSMYHGTLLMYHGTLLMYHGTFSYGL